MKQRFLILALCLLSIAVTASADKPQKGKGHGGPAQVNLTDRIADELGLDDATAAKFSTVYNQYVAEMHAAYKQHAMTRPQKGEDGKKQRLTDEQIKHNLEAQLDLSQSILDLRKKYYKEYLKILTPRQIEKLGKLEKKQAGKVQDSFSHRQMPEMRPGQRPGRSVMPPRAEKK